MWKRPKFAVAVLLWAGADVASAAVAEGPGEGLAADFWVDRAQLTAAQRRSQPPWCAGAYRLPVAPRQLSIPMDSLPITAAADAASYAEDDWVELQGDVVIRQGERTLYTRHAKINQSTQVATFDEGARILDSGLAMQGVRAEVNLDSGAAQMRQAQFLLADAELRGRARTAARNAEGDILLAGSAFTRCTPGNRNWTVQAGKLRLPEGEVFGSARHAVLKVRGVPVFYSPYIQFPVSDERKSGFLFPFLGFSGEKGVELSLPYYLNLAPNYDATLTPRWLGERGVAAEGEFRHLSRWDRTQFTAGYLPNDKLHNGELDRDDWLQRRAVGAAEDEFDPADRWLLGLQHQGRLGRLRSRVDYTEVSDRDYFRVLGGDGVGVRRINLLRFGELSYAQGGLSMRLWARSFQRLDEIRRPEYSQAPALDIAYRTEGPGPLQLSLDARTASFDRNATGLRGIQALTGDRTHLAARLAAPLSWPFGFFSASVGYQHTAYQLDSDAEPLADDSRKRGIPTAAVGGGLVFERDLNLFGTGVIQTLEPRLRYFYQGYEDQDQLPLFDATDLTFGYQQLFRSNRFSGLDRIGDANQLAIGLTSRFLNRADGREHLRASLGQILHFKDRRVALRGRPDDDAERNVSALAGELAAQFSNRWRLSATLIWDPSDNQVDEGAAALSYRAGGRRLFNLAYRNRLRDKISQTDISFHWPVARKYAVIGRWNHDLASGRTIEGMAGIEYNDCCLRIRLVARHYLDQPAARSLAEVDEDSGVFLQILFKGLAGLGGGVDTMLERSVYGYSAAN